MKAIIKEVGNAPKVIDIENTLEALQKTVGGYIETLNVGGDIVMICDEEGKLKGYPFNFSFGGKLSDVIVGNVLFVQVSGEDFTDLNSENIEAVMKFFNRT